MDHRLEVVVARRLAHAFKMRREGLRIALEPRQGEPHRRLLERAAHLVDLVLRAAHDSR